MRKSSISVPFISADQVRSLVAMEEAIAAMRPAFIQLGRGEEALVPTRLSLDLPDKNAAALVMSAYTMGSPYYTVKTVCVNYSNTPKGLLLIHAVVQVFEASKGHLAAIMDGGSITAIRTGAASGLATDLLANKTAKVLAVFGTGIQARTQVEAVLAFRNIKKILVFSRTAEHTNSFFQLDLRCVWYCSGGRTTGPVK